MSQKQAHLEMIQGIVNRLSHNSFLLKGWTVILISALFALAAKDKNALFISLAYFPAIAFWCLDGYFLWQERLFRALYDYVRLLEEENIDYSMNVNKANVSGITWAEAFLSKTLIMFHGVILISIIIVMIFSFCGGDNG
ncbi:hypothetical protein KAR91_32665 [Candidatus Pacearchaeota archaeon]|nr:hypothetical protein [Candidatus Pacearchaeota archaeon]